MPEQLSIVEAPEKSSIPDDLKVDQVVILEQLPIIKERLELLKEYVAKETDNAMSLVATPDTLASVRKTRADLNREFSELDAMRKKVKEAVMGPYTDFEAKFKECVSVPFRAADKHLKGKIDAVEGTIKADCEKKLVDYFSELKTVHKLDWLQYDRLGIRVSLTDAKKKTPSNLMQQIEHAVGRIAGDCDAIAGMGEDAPEIMAEYKVLLNLSQAVSYVQDRRKRAEAERQAAAQRAEDARREAERQQAIQAAMPQPAPESGPLQAPTVEPVAEPPALYTVAFTIRGTRDQIVALKQYLAEHEIEVIK